MLRNGAVRPRDSSHELARDGFAEAAGEDGLAVLEGFDLRRHLEALARRAQLRHRLDAAAVSGAGEAGLALDAGTGRQRIASADLVDLRQHRIVLDADIEDLAGA